jgi:hypothetical protein
MGGQQSGWGGRPVFVVDGSRTPFIKARGKPGPFSASDLAVAAASPLLIRQPFAPSDFDEVILGCVMPGPNEANIGRVVALRLGCGERVTAWTVQRNCASGLQSIDTAAQNIASGRSALVLAGGVESMSHAPVLLGTAMVNWLASWNRARTLGARLKTLAALKPAYLRPVIALLRGLTDPVVGLSMGQTAEILAHRFAISREQMDAFALRSHQRLATAMDSGHLDEITARSPPATVPRSPTVPPGSFWPVKMSSGNTTCRYWVSSSTASGPVSIRHRWGSVPPTPWRRSCSDTGSIQQISTTGRSTRPLPHRYCPVSRPGRTPGSAGKNSGASRRSARLTRNA